VVVIQCSANISFIYCLGCSASFLPSHLSSVGLTIGAVIAVSAGAAASYFTLLT